MWIVYSWKNTMCSYLMSYSPSEERKQTGTNSYYPHFTSTVIHLKKHVVTNSKMICVGFDEIDPILYSGYWNLWVYTCSCMTLAILQKQWIYTYFFLWLPESIYPKGVCLTSTSFSLIKSYKIRTINKFIVIYRWREHCKTDYGAKGGPEI